MAGRSASRLRHFLSLGRVACHGDSTALATLGTFEFVYTAWPPPCAQAGRRTLKVSLRVPRPWRIALEDKFILHFLVLQASGFGHAASSVLTQPSGRSPSPTFPFFSDLVLRHFNSQAFYCCFCCPSMNAFPSILCLCMPLTVLLPTCPPHTFGPAPLRFTSGCGVRAPHFPTLTHVSCLPHACGCERERNILSNDLFLCSVLLHGE